MIRVIHSFIRCLLNQFANEDFGQLKSKKVVCRQLNITQILHDCDKRITRITARPSINYSTRKRKPVEFQVPISSEQYHMKENMNNAFIFCRETISFRLYAQTNVQNSKGNTNRIQSFRIFSPADSTAFQPHTIILGRASQGSE